MYKRGRLILIRHEFLKASTSIEIRNDDKNDEEVKKNNINDDTEKSNLQ